MMRWVTVLVAHASLCFAFAADLGLTPPRMELRGPPGGVVEGISTLFTSASTHVQVSVDGTDWILDVSGSIAYVPAGTVAASATTWLTLDVADFVLDPGSDRTVRVEARIPADAEGTYHSMVLFSVEANEGVEDGIGVSTTTRVGLTVYVTAAGTERDGSELVDMYQSGERTIAAVILNTGNTVMRLGGVVEIRDEAGDVVRRLDVPDVPVLRESERELAFALPDDLPSGFYVALALIEDSRGGVLAGELPFDLP